MAIKLPSHLHRNRSGILHFRIAIPPDIRHYFNSNEIYRSLKTASIHDATPVAQTLSIAFKRVFSEIRQESMSDQNKALKDALELFKSLPDARERIKAAGIRIALHEAEAGRERAEDLHAESEARHQRELALVLQAKATIAPAEDLQSSPLLSETVTDFARAKRAQGKWTDKTEAENRAVYGLFIRIVGDKPIAQIDDGAIVEYLETLKALPPNINKSPAYIGKTIAEIIALARPPMSDRTLNKNIERVSSLFKWATTKKKYGITHNPAANMGIKESGAEKRKPFAAQELAALFSSEEFTTRKFQKSYTYWLMPLGLLTGARLGELAQLYLSDFVEYDGIPCISISDEGEGQRLKNDNAKRIVPIHDKLIELGLLRYVEALRSKNETRLFPELNQRRDGFGQAASRWFQDHKKKCGIEGKHTKVFHSFRHTFISALLNDEVPVQSVAQIVGHEGQLITSQVYWNNRDAAKRKPTIEKYQPPPEVWQLIPKFEDVTVSKGRG